MSPIWYRLYLRHQNLEPANPSVGAKDRASAERRAWLERTPRASGIGRPGLRRDVHRTIAQLLSDGPSACKISMVLGIDPKDGDESANPNGLDCKVMVQAGKEDIDEEYEDPERQRGTTRISSWVSAFREPGCLAASAASI